MVDPRAPWQDFEREVRDAFRIIAAEIERQDRLRRKQHPQPARAHLRLVKKESA
jgi:hypothetical protein